MTAKLAWGAFLSFLFLLVWVALALRVVPGLVEDITEDSVYRAVLNLGISGTLLAVPGYTIFRLFGRPQSA